MHINDFLNQPTLWTGFSTPKATEEDPEASQAAFEEKDITPHLAPYDPYTLLPDLYDPSILQPLHHYATQSAAYTAHIYRSYKHLTLPEALIYCTLLLKPNLQIRAAVLRPCTHQHTPATYRLSCELYNSQQQPLAAYTLCYTARTRVVRIEAEGRPIGKVSYHFRGQKCEEITGKLFNTPLLLDPVWHPHKKGFLKYERFVYGAFRQTLIYQANKKQAARSALGTPNAFASRITPQKQTLHYTWVTKSVQFKQWSIKSILLFHRHLLIPCSASWVFAPLPADK